LGSAFRDELPVIGDENWRHDTSWDGIDVAQIWTCGSAKQEISIAAQLQILELTAKGRPTNLDLR
jgi:hypothetical protein